MFERRAAAESIVTLTRMYKVSSFYNRLALGLAVCAAISADGRLRGAVFQNVPPSPVVAQSPADSPERALVKQYCIGCHNQRQPTQNLAFDLLGLDDVGVHAEVWEKVVRKLESGAMPPAGARRPPKAVVDAALTSLTSALDRAAAASPNPGKVTIHRLNRTEYTNAVRDLLHLDIDARSLLPADDSGYGFDNIADVLSMSPGLLERYMSAARKISRAAVGDPALRPTVDNYRVSAVLLQQDRMSEQLPFGSRGGIAIRHHFPLDGEYQLTIRLQRTWRDEIRGLAEPNRLEVRLDRARIAQFTIGGEGPRGVWLSTQAVPTPTEYEMTADQGLTVRFAAKAGQRVIGVSFVREGSVLEGVLPPPLPASSFEFAGYRDAPMGVDAVQVSGPFGGTRPIETPSRARIFVCAPASAGDELPCARRILSALAQRAYRRPVTQADVDALMQFFAAGRRKGSFDAGVDLAIQGILVDPDFLFRVERDPSGSTGGLRRLTDLELASRLSFFLWSSIPDDELLDVAIKGRLHEPEVLTAQVRRLLADPKASALVTSFAGQWLWLRNMRALAPDTKAYPDFDDNLREAFQRETELFLQSTLREDRNVVDLLTANYTFVNERLARHYGIPKVYGSHFRRVTLPDNRRGGLLGHGSILTATSYTTRTSPVTRGKWVLENILGAPPPPPPPNVPDLNETSADGKALSMRAAMEQHRANPVCASCHARMDPLGLALENFDAIGMWRTVGADRNPIDASGAMPDGTRFDGPAELRAMLQGRSREFVTALTEKLLVYGVGRGLEYFDAPAVRAIVRGAESQGYRWSAIIAGIARSTPFTMRQMGEPGRAGPASTVAERARP
jgi:hypothetical protein